MILVGEKFLIHLIAVESGLNEISRNLFINPCPLDVFYRLGLIDSVGNPSIWGVIIPIQH